MSIEEDNPINTHQPASLPAVIGELHSDLKLCGTPKNALLDVSDDLLIYLLSILRNEASLPPKASAQQWSDLISILKSHWIIPLFYRQIGALSPQYHPPEFIAAQMRMAWLESRVRTIHMEHQLRKILNAFQFQGVRTLIVRGPALAWLVYPDPALRPSSDLDLLVLPEQVSSARAILEEMGYQCLSKRFEGCRTFFREECFIHRENPRNNLMIDLHWALWELHPSSNNRDHIGVRDLFSRAVTVNAPTLSFKTLHPVDALIHAAVHLTMIHGKDMRLIWIYDIVLIARHLHAPHEWEELQEKSVAWRGRLALEYATKLAKVWYNLQLHDGFDDFSRWPEPAAEETETWLHLTRDHWVTVLLKRNLFNLSWLLKMFRSVFYLLFPPPAVVRFCYPPPRPWLLPLSYIRRWYRWFFDLLVKRVLSFEPLTKTMRKR